MTAKRAAALFALVFAAALVPGVALGAPSSASSDEARADDPSASVLSVGAGTQLKAAQVDPGVYTVCSALDARATLDVAAASAADGAQIQLYAANSTAAQRWRFEELPGSLWRMVNVGSGKVLSLAGGKAASGVRVVQSAWTGADSQKWKLSVQSGGYRVTPALSDELALDATGGSTANGTLLKLHRINGTPAQTWALAAVVPAVADGVYRLEAQCSGKMLDVAGGKVSGRAGAQQYAANGTAAQNFSLRYDKDTGYYTVLAANSGLVLDVANGAVGNGAKVWFYDHNGSFAQKWALRKNADGSMSLLSAKSGKALDVAGASRSNGASVQIYRSNGTAAQSWKLEAVSDWLPDGVYEILSSKTQATALAVSQSSRSSGAKVQAAARKSGEWAQSWVICRQGSSGYYTIRSLNSRQALDVAGDAAARGARLQQAGMDKGAGQLFKPVLGIGGITFVSKLNENYVVDLAGGKTSAGTAVQLYTANSTAAQRFRLKQIPLSTLLAGKTFFVRSLAQNTVLDVKGGSSADGTPIWLHAANGTSAQKFRFVSKGSDNYALINVKTGKAVAASGAGLAQRGTGSAASQKWRVFLDAATGAFRFTSAQTGKRMESSGASVFQAAASTGTAQLFSLQPTSGDYFRVYLNSGHGWNSNGNGVYDPGAQANGNVEADLCSELSDLVIKYARELYGLDVVDGRPYKLAYWKRLPKAIELKCSVIFSIHFDIDSGSGSGPMGMVGVDGRHPSSLRFNNIMLKHLAGSLPALPNRGTYYRNDITCVNGNIPACLVEVAFVDNPRDMAYYKSRKDTVARELAAGLYESSLESSLRRAG